MTLTAGRMRQATKTALPSYQTKMINMPQPGLMMDMPLLISGIIARDPRPTQERRQHLVGSIGHQSHRVGLADPDHDPFPSGIGPTLRPGGKGFNRSHATRD